MNEIQELKQEIEKIHERNRRVEASKAWETSTFRAMSLVVLTYIVVVIAMFVLRTTRPFISALIPTLGFFLSIQSLPLLKKWWIKNRYKGTM